MNDLRQKNFQRLVKQSHGAVYLYGEKKNTKKFIDFIGKESVRYIKGIVLAEKDISRIEFMGIPIFSRIEDIPELDRSSVILTFNDIRAREMEGVGCVIPLQKVMPIMGVKGYAKWRSLGEYYRKYMQYFEGAGEMPLFKYIEIETVNRCNGECSFCPVNKNMPQRDYRKMSDEMFYDIVNQLAALKFNGTIALFENNEPFIDERIVDFAKYTREKCPDAYIYLKTNGTLLSTEKFKEIIEYLDFLGVDNYHGGEDKIPEKFEEMKIYCKEKEYPGRFRFYSINKNAERSSRGGNAPNMKIWYTTEIPCPLLFVQMSIRPDGKVSLCCNDALGENTLGDVSKNTLVEIWRSETFRNLRKAMTKSERYGIETCRYCNHLDGRELWKSRGGDFIEMRKQYVSLIKNVFLYFFQ